MSYDHHDGIDYGLVPFTRRPNGTPVLDEPHLITAKVTGATGTPGAALLRKIFEEV